MATNETKGKGKAGELQTPVIRYRLRCDRAEAGRGRIE